MIATASRHTRLDDAPVEDDGPIEPSKPREEVRQEPYPLPKDFEWCMMDITDSTQVRINCSLVGGTM